MVQPVLSLRRTPVHAVDNMHLVLHLLKHDKEPMMNMCSS